MNKPLFLAVCMWLLVLGTSHEVWAQAEDSCRLEYDFLWEDASPQTNEISVGTKLQLSAAFLNYTQDQTMLQATIDKPMVNTNHNTENRFQTQTFYTYQYLRPASRRELKLMLVEGDSLEVVREDSNVYAPEIWKTKAIFFEAADQSLNDYQAKFVDGRLILPSDLKAANIDPTRHKILEITEKHENYWLIEVVGGSWIFYPHAYDVSTVFDIPQNNIALDAKKEAGQQLVGKTLVHISENAVTNWEIQSVIPTYTAAKLTLASIDEQAETPTMTLELAPDMPFEIYDPACLEAAKKAEAERLLALEQAAQIARAKVVRDSIVQDSINQEIAIRDSIRQVELQRELAIKDSLKADSIYQLQLALEEEERLQAAIQADREKLLAEMEAEKANANFTNAPPLSPGRTAKKKSKQYDKFELIEDPIKNTRWYLHQNQSLDKIIKESYLKLNLSEEGNIYLQSILTTDALFKHIQIKVEIGEYVWESDKIYTYNERNVVYTFDDYLQESIHFTSKDTDEIVGKIAQQFSENIWISFINEQGEIRRVAFSLAQKEAFRDTYRLYREIKD